MRSPDLIRPLQNQSTLITYRDCWKSLLSFYYRLLLADNPFNRQLFTVEIAQRRAWQSVLLRAKILDNNLEDSAEESSSSTNFSYTSLKSSGSDSQDIEIPKISRDRAQLDRAVLRFSMSLLDQKVEKSVFHSPILGFCALRAFDTKNNSWYKPGDFSSVLSQLIYLTQLLTILYASRRSKYLPQMTFSSVVEYYRDRYLLNTNNTPISELLNIRLLATSIGRIEVTIAPIR